MKRASITLPPPCMQHEQVRAVHATYGDLLLHANRTTQRLRELGQHEYADALERCACKLSRMARLNMRKLAAQANRAANTNARENAA